MYQQKMTNMYCCMIKVLRKAVINYSAFSASGSKQQDTDQSLDFNMIYIGNSNTENKTGMRKYI